MPTQQIAYLPYTWILCARQCFVRAHSAYLVGGHVPDLRGLFLRGFGGKSTVLGTTQDQTTASSGIQTATAFID